MAPAEFPVSIQLLKTQDPWPPFQMVTLLMQPLVKFPLRHHIKSCRSSTSIEGRAPAAFTVVTKREFHQGSPHIPMRPADEIPFSIQLLKIQEPCPPFQMVSLSLCAGQRIIIPFMSREIQCVHNGEMQSI